VLGTDVGPLSPCRIAAGDPSAVADSFARAIFRGDLKEAREYESSTAEAPFEKSLASLYLSRKTAEAVRTRRTIPAENAACRYQRGRGAVACYAYQPVGTKDPGAQFFLTIRCDGRDWHVSTWG
jgi:hypothetical protein